MTLRRALICGLAFAAVSYAVVLLHAVMVRCDSLCELRLRIRHVQTVVIKPDRPLGWPGIDREAAP